MRLRALQQHPRDLLSKVQEEALVTGQPSSSTHAGERLPAEGGFTANSYPSDLVQFICTSLVGVLIN